MIRATTTATASGDYYWNYNKLKDTIWSSDNTLSNGQDLKEINLQIIDDI